MAASDAALRQADQQRGYATAQQPSLPRFMAPSQQGRPAEDQHQQQKKEMGEEEEEEEEQEDDEEEAPKPKRRGRGGAPAQQEEEEEEDRSQRGRSGKGVGVGPRSQAAAYRPERLVRTDAKAQRLEVGGSGTRPPRPCPAAHCLRVGSVPAVLLAAGHAGGTGGPGPSPAEEVPAGPCFCGRCGRGPGRGYAGGR